MWQGIVGIPSFIGLKMWALRSSDLPKTAWMTEDSTQVFSLWMQRFFPAPMRAHQVSSGLSQSLGCVQSPAFRAQVSLGNTFPSLQLLFPLVFANPVPDRIPPSLASSMPIHSTLVISGLGQGPLHPGFSEVTLFGNPPGANLSHLFRREAEETHPTHSP